MIFVISGPSGSGKTTLASKLINNPGIKGKLRKSISLTTRAKRSGEKNGRDYFFISRGEFQQAKDRKKILEWTRYLGYDYGTSKGFIEEQVKKSKHILLCLDLKGACKVKRLYPHETVTIFVHPPLLEVLRERIEKRCPRTKKCEIQKRLKLARKEILAAQDYDYSVVNKNLKTAVKQLREIVLKEISEATTYGAPACPSLPAGRGRQVSEHKLFGCKFAPPKAGLI